MRPLKSGDKAPLFSLPDQYGEIINLSDYFSQRVFVYFYLNEMTPGCKLQACGIRDKMDELNQMEVEIFEISTINQKNYYILKK